MAWDNELIMREKQQEQAREDAERIIFEQAVEEAEIVTIGEDTSGGSTPGRAGRRRGCTHAILCCCICGSCLNTYGLSVGASLCVF